MRAPVDLAQTQMSEMPQMPQMSEVPQMPQMSQIPQVPDKDSKSTFTINAKITNLDEGDGILKFTISDINVSFINAIRRVLLSDIPVIGFKTAPYKDSKVNIITNKTRLNNELIKQRISSIPIHLDATEDFNYEDYVVELNKKNDTNITDFVTTADFKMRNIKADSGGSGGGYLEKAEIISIFPPDPITHEFIDIVRLRPKIAENIASEHLHFTATLSICYARDDGVYNVVSTCAYGNSPDKPAIDTAWSLKEKDLKAKFQKDEDKGDDMKNKIDFIKEDWYLLNAKRLFLADSFDFVLESVGIYGNFQLMELATLVIIKRLNGLIDSLKANMQELVKEATDTMENCYIVTLENEDYTIGKIIEFYLYDTLFRFKRDLNFVGFLKRHPHDSHSIIKISYKMPVSKDDVVTNIEDAANQSILLMNSIKTYFKG